jgi:hypothetical protein
MNLVAGGWFFGNRKRATSDQQRATGHKEKIK